MKEYFSTALIDAIANDSAQKLYLLCSDFDDQKKMGIDSDYTEAKLTEIILKNCTTFLATIDFDINEFVLDSVSIVGDEESVELESGYFAKFPKSINLLLKKEGSSRLNIDVEMPIILDNKIKINNPLLIKCHEYEESAPVICPDSITVTDSNNQTLELSICHTDVVQAYLKEHANEAQDYISNEPWYLYEGNMVLDRFSFTSNIIINGDLSIHEGLVEITTSLIVMGETVVNAIALDESNDVFLLGGIKFNVAVISMMSGPFRVLRNLNGPFVYTDSDSTQIEGTDGVMCYVDHSYGESHGDILSTIKEKYFEIDEDEDIDIDARLIANDIKFGENIFNDSQIIKSFISVKEPDLDNKASIISLLEEDAFYFKKLDEKYRSDKELIDIAITHHAEIFKYIAKHLQEDDTYIYELMRKNGDLLAFVNKRFRQDKDLVLLAIESTPYALAYASKSLRADKDVVRKAVKKNARVLEYADKSLQADEDILIDAINNDPDAIKYAPHSVIDNEKVILALIKKAPRYLDEDALADYRNNKEFVMEAIEENHLVFNYLDNALQADVDIRKLAGRV